MNKNKVKKTFTEFYYHDSPKPNFRNLKEIVYASIDPGKINFSIRIEKRSTTEYSVSPLYHNLLEIKKIRYGTDQSLLNLSNFLDSLDKYLSKCHLFIIEKQLKINRIASEIMFHVKSHLMFRYYNSELRPSIFLIEPKLKNCILTLDPTNHKDIKVKTIKACELICTLRNDKLTQEFIDSCKKKDDVCDVICQAEAFFHEIKMISVLDKINKIE